MTKNRDRSRTRRTYPFTEKVPNPSSVTTTTSSGRYITIDASDWHTTVYKPNPFHGIDKWLFAFDEWAHRHDLNKRGPLRLVCNFWEWKVTRVR